VTDEQLNRQIVQPAADAARDDRAHRFLYLGAVLFLLGLGFLAWQWFSQHQQINELRKSSNDDRVQAGQLYRQVQALGGTPVVQPSPPAATPGPTGPTGPAGPGGPGPTQAQIDAAVAAYIAAHPPAAGTPATPAMVATAVAEYLTAHPPTPGRPPTPQEIATAASNYIGGHSADFKGSTGATGANGANATDAQVAAAVAVYCSAHGNCAGAVGASGPTGAPGAQGPQGVSFTDLRFVRDSSGTCHAIASFHDPATGKDSSVTHSAGDAACPLTLPLIPTP
jgi:hypothetical protein